ncbi:polyketide cyclase [Devosia riboflavina]|uniref:Polyketide cyclase n=1 Tax=Devosia riboflavina TaxID=46914 RepID=A0A087M3Y3_9HYPH|nr:SRPBCC family protein [Devosia riboflavina]KFL31586.1 polyketide cyclase [Devosia riboflavina]
MSTDNTIDNERDLVLTRLIDASPAAVYSCWTDPELMKKWFAPKPWSTPRVTLDLRPGGGNVVVMADEAGNEYPNPGQYLEVVPNKKLVFTDAFVGDWKPSGKPFFTCVLTFDDEGGKTRYTAVARHWAKEDKEAHEKMGFHEGWGLCAAQLEEVAKGL